VLHGLYGVWCKADEPVDEFDDFEYCRMVFGCFECLDEYWSFAFDGCLGNCIDGISMFGRMKLNAVSEKRKKNNNRYLSDWLRNWRNGSNCGLANRLMIAVGISVPKTLVLIGVKVKDFDSVQSLVVESDGLLNGGRDDLILAGARF
jgi:hypothetical protein